MHPLYGILVEALRIDAAQMVEEGHDVEALNREVDAAAASGSLDALAALQVDLWNRPSPPGFAYDEPNDWETIASAFPEADSHEPFGGNADDLADRLLAAWRGRCAGCQLGKPVEGLTEPEKVRRALAACDSWPLTDYINPLPDPAAAADGTPESHLSHWQHLTKGRIQYVEPDDDIHYTIAGLCVLERYGLDFTARDVIETIARLTPQGILFASGLNMVRTGVIGFDPPVTALLNNRFRQSLGATIRCDPFGWAAPANPALAAELAYRDASASQRRNGIYAGIFFATLIADVFSHGDPTQAIETAAQYVPPRSRLAEMIRFVQDTCRTTDDWVAANEIILDRYHRRLLRAENVGMNHCLPNAAICIMALLKGAGDFDRTITVGVMAGMDTDCNGATLGSIMGAALGTAGIDRRWTGPFNDTVRTELLGMGELTITDLARRTFNVARPNGRYRR